MPDEVLTAAQRLADEMAGLRTDVTGLAKAVSSEAKAAHRWRWLTVAVAIVSVVTLALVVGVVANVRYSAHQASCVRQYTNDNAARNNAITPLSTERAKDEDAFFKVLATQDKALITPIYLRLVKADDAYETALATHPLPLAPKYAC